VRTNHKLLDLFSGIGGFSLAAEQNGIETIAFVEKEKFCQKVLKKHWSDVPIIDDIRKVNGKDFGAATIISGGFPCQPFSVAGKRRGTDDDRYLWDETIRVVAECKPRWFIGENVEGIINIQDGMVLRQVQDDLEKEGFQVQCLVIPASGIGAWHQRKRVWIIGYSEHNGNVSNTNSRLRRRRGTIKESGENKIWGFYPSQEEQTKQHIRSETIRCDVVSGKFNEGEQPTQSWWQTESKLCGVPNGVSYELDKGRADRIKALGNSIVPQIAEQIFRSIIDAE